MSKTIDLNPNCLKPIRKIDERLVSYNIEMTEVTGGTFWKAYTPGQIAGTEEFPPMAVRDLKDITAMAELMEYYPPIDLYNRRLRSLAKALGPAWIRVSGSWATKTLVLVYKCGQEKLNHLYYQVKEQRRCSTWLKTRNPTLRNSNSRLWICIMPEGPRIHSWNVNMA